MHVVVLLLAIGFSDDAKTRVWTSADGLYSKEATFIRSSPVQVILLNIDGTVIRIRPDQLSYKDQMFIRNREWEFTIEPGRVDTEKFAAAKQARQTAKAARLQQVQVIAATKAADRRSRLKTRKEFQSNEYMLATSLYNRWYVGYAGYRGGYAGYSLSNLYHPHDRPYYPRRYR